MKACEGENRLLFEWKMSRSAGLSDSCQLSDLGTVTNDTIQLLYRTLGTPLVCLALASLIANAGQQQRNISD